MLKKFIKFLSVVGLIGAPVCSVVACGGNSKWDQFQNLLDKKDSFVYFIGGKDCPKCKSTHQTVWDDLSKPSSQDPDHTNLYEYINSPDSKYKDYTVWNLYMQDGTKTRGYDSYSNLAVYNYDVDKVADVFDDGFVKKLVDYMIAQTEKAASIDGQSIKYLKRSDLKLTGAPFFVYIDSGQYEGFSQGEITSLTLPEGETPGFFPLVYKHIFQHGWKPWV